MKHWKECVLIILIVALTNAFADTVTIMPIGDSGIDQLNPTNNLGGATDVVSGELGVLGGFKIRRARDFPTREDPVNAPRLVINFTPPSPPTIVTQPQSQTNFVGSTVVLNVTANGTPPPSYIWQFNGMPIPGGTDPTLVLNNVQTN